MTIGIVIQARMGSSRLPGKVLRPLNGIPLLGHILGRLDSLKSTALIVVATTQNGKDDAIAQYCADAKTQCFRGSEEDVLARYCACAARFTLAQVVRLTGDNPFTDVEELDRMIAMHLNAGNDYSNSIDVLPIGVGAEAFTTEALLRSESEGRLPRHREHVNEYILENPSSFKTGRLEGVSVEKRRPDVRLTVDTEQDFRRASYVAAHARGKWAGTVEAIELCSRFA